MLGAKIMATPVRIDRIEEALFTILQAQTTADVAWAYGQPTFEQRATNIVDLIMTAPPTGKHQGLAGGLVFQPFTSATYRVTTNTEGDAVQLEINEDITVRVDVQAGQSLEDVRNALVARLSSNPEFDPWTAAPGAAVDELVLTPTEFASVYKVVLLSGVAFVSAVEPDAFAELYEQEMDFTVQLQSFSKHRSLSRGASAISTQLQGLFRVQNTHDLLQKYGIAVVNVGPAVDISAIAGSNWETRASFDVDFAVQMRQTAPVDVIDSHALDKSRHAANC
jgi:hypothetical protein